MSDKLTIEEAETLGEKIEAFAATLSQRERDALASALWHGDDDDEVGGFSKLRPPAKSVAGLSFGPGRADEFFAAVKGSGPVKPKGGGTLWEPN